MILFFDTTDFDAINFALVDPASGKTKQQKVRMHHFDSEKTLPALDAFLKKHKVQFGAKAGGEKGASGRSIEKIYFVAGPGSFSGIRVGASLALAFGFAKGIPVYALKKNQVPQNFNRLPEIRAKKIGAIPDLDYGGAPKITKEKKKQLRNT